MNIAVTGANGHVGINLCKSLLEHGHTVRALAHRHDGAIRSLPLSVIKGDVLEPDSLRNLMTGSEVVMHLAARISITGDPDGMVYRINTEGSRNMVAIARECGVKRFIHFSSIHACRQHPLGKPIDETRPLVEADGFAYDRSKAEGERVVMAAAASGLNAVVLSPTAIIGPEDPEPSLAGKAVIDIFRDKIPALVPGGYDWVDVRDVVNAAIAAINQGRAGEKYLLSGHWCSLQEFSKLVGQYTGKKTVQTILPMWTARLGLPFISVYAKLSATDPLYTSESLTILAEGNREISNDKARRELGFNPRPLAETMCDFIAWLRAHNQIT